MTADRGIRLRSDPPGWWGEHGPHHPTPAELAAFRRRIIPGSWSHYAAHWQCFTARPNELRWGAPERAGEWGHGHCRARRQASAMRSRAYAGSCWERFGPHAHNPLLLTRGTSEQACYGPIEPYSIGYQTEHDRRQGLAPR